MLSVNFYQACALFLFLVLPKTFAEVTEEQYGQMPELFYHDNFDHCMLGGERSLYCTFTYALEPLENSTSDVWKIIKEVSDDERNYRHDHLRHGICVPYTCSEFYSAADKIDFKEVIKKCYDKKYQPLGLKGNVTEMICQTKKSGYPINYFDIIFAAIVGFYLIFVLCSSIYERFAITEKNEHKMVNQILTSFSVRRNWKRLTTVSANSEHDQLRSMQGLRFYVMFFVMMSHTLMCVFAGPVSNPIFTENSSKLTFNIIISNGWYIVQTFFVMSGWLVSYFFFTTVAKDKNFKISKVYLAIINRYIRLIPAYAFVVGLHATWFVHLSSGPNWDMFSGNEFRKCKRNGWTNLLFVHNLIDPSHMCLPHTWYLAVDMQLSILAVLILHLLWHFPNKKKIIFGFFLLMGLLVPATVAYINKYDIVMRQYPEFLYNISTVHSAIWRHVYISTYSNIFGYVIGMVFGYIFFTYKDTKWQIRLIHHVTYYALILCLMVSVMVAAPLYIYSPGFVVTPLNSAIYWACGKSMFALGAAVVILGITRKMGSIIRKLAEFPPLQVLGRLTYSAYVIHVVFLVFEMGYRRFPASANNFLLFQATLGNVVCAYLAATLLCLLVEMPISALRKVTGIRTEASSNKDPKGISNSEEMNNKNCDTESNQAAKSVN